MTKREIWESCYISGPSVACDCCQKLTIYRIKIKTAFRDERGKLYLMCEECFFKEGENG